MATASTEARLLIVDDEPMVRDLLCAFLEDNGFTCESSPSVDDALLHLQQGNIDLVISDLHMPGRTGLELLEAIGSKHPHTAFLMATAAPDTKTAVQAMRKGAADFLVKPLDLSQVLATVRSTLARRADTDAASARQQQAESLLAERTQQLGLALQQVELQSKETLRAVAMTLDVRAHDVAGHCLRVSRYSLELAAQMGYSEADLQRIEHASYLHDIGKLGIPDAILNKPGALTPEEQTVMRSHVQIGYDMVTKVPSLADAAELVLAHQEHFDGSGYPRGLKGEEIPLDARIFSVADTLDAMTSDRPYRKAMSWEQASQEIAHQAGKQFDPAVVAAFQQIPASRWRQLQTGPNAASAGSAR
ncbi:MAG: HD domain-containing phosphohydrolase [Terriglobales bacterium]